MDIEALFDLFEAISKECEKRGPAILKANAKLYRIAMAELRNQGFTRDEATLIISRQGHGLKLSSD